MMGLRIGCDESTSDAAHPVTDRDIVTINSRCDGMHFLNNSLRQWYSMYARARAYAHVCTSVCIHSKMLAEPGVVYQAREHARCLSHNTGETLEGEETQEGGPPQEGGPVRRSQRGTSGLEV